MKILIFLLALLAQITSCNPKYHQAVYPETIPADNIPEEHPTVEKEQLLFHLPYDLDEPADRFVLPEALKEISGLSMTADNKEVLTAVQDENGILFQVNKKTGLLEKEITFYKNGDYEGLEIVGETVYVVKSSGTIYEIKDLEQTPPSVAKHKFFLSKENDVEGLCYDAKANRLLLACKGIPATGETEEITKYKKAIYSFSLEKKQLELEPAFVFTLEDIQLFLKKSKETEHHEKLCGYFKTEDVESLIFSPSAIAIHPLSGNLYMTSSIKKLLMVFDPEGNILHLEKMDKIFHPQPEGLSFDEDGTLYMSNEGKEAMGTILRFSYNPL